MRQIVVYHDRLGQKLFSTDLEGVLLEAARGASAHPNQTVISFDGGRSSIAEAFAAGASPLKGYATTWDAFGTWFKARGNA